MASQQGVCGTAGVVIDISDRLDDGMDITVAKGIRSLLYDLLDECAPNNLVIDRLEMSLRNVEAAAVYAAEAETLSEGIHTYMINGSDLRSKMDRVAQDLDAFSLVCEDRDEPLVAARYILAAEKMRSAAKWLREAHTLAKHY